MADFLILGVYRYEYLDQLYAAVRMYYEDTYVDEDIPLPRRIRYQHTELIRQFVKDVVPTRIGELKRGIPYEESFLQMLMPGKEGVNERVHGHRN